MAAATGTIDNSLSTSYKENINILADSWNAGRDAARTFGEVLNKTVVILYDQDKARTVRQALQIIAADLVDNYYQ